MTLSEIVTSILTDGDPKGFKTDTLLQKYSANIEVIIPLLTSKEPEALEIGSYLAAESGVWGKALKPYVANLLNASSPHVRYKALQCMMLWTDSNDLEILVHIWRLLDDIDWRVRLNAMSFFGVCVESSIQAIRENLDEVSRKNIDWLLRVENDLDFSEIISRLKSSERCDWQIGFIAALRISYLNEEPLAFAIAYYENEELQRIAESSEGFSSRIFAKKRNQKRQHKKRSGKRKKS